MLGDARMVVLAMLVFCLSLVALRGELQLERGPAPRRLAVGASAAGDGGRPREGGAPVGQVARLRDGGKLDINRASEDELQLLPGVGPALAARIVEDRHNHGRYRTLADLERVSGIGSRTLARIATLAAVGSEADPAATRNPTSGSP